MKILFVFDSYPKTGDTGRLRVNNSDAVYLFPLTSVSRITSTIEEEIKQKGCNVEIIQTASVINSSADSLRNRYIQFIAELPAQIKHKGRNLKEYFGIDRYATLWWFSLISEKNIYKSDAFNRLAQLDAIINLIRFNKIEKIILWCKSKKLEDALLGYAKKNTIRFETLPINLLNSLEAYALKFQKIFYAKHVFLLLNFAMNLFARTCKVKRNLSALKRASNFYDKPLLLITPYPNIDISLAKKDIFKNKFYPYLQETLEAKGRDITWAAMYVDNGSLSFSASLRYAKRFIKNGYVIFFLEEFNSIGIQIGALITMLKKGLKFLRIEKRISDAHIFNGYNFYPLFRDDWYSSFTGHTGYAGILYYRMFRSLLNKVKAKKCLYLCEMHAWEKALISAREAAGCAMSLYGYQSTVISRMLLNYFNGPGEVAGNGSYTMPRPEKIISNGQLTYNYMKESGWPEANLLVGEAVRYNHLKKCLKTKWDKKKDIILLVLSISPEESSSILTIAYDALKDFKDKEIWVKPHPFLNFKKVFEFSGISEENFPFHIKAGPIESFLSGARIVICGESGISVEALAFGCEVIIVNVPEWINMSPLKSVKNRMVRTVNSPEELSRMVISILNEGYEPERCMLEAKEIVDERLYLNQHSDTPDIFLKLLIE